MDTDEEDMFDGEFLRAVCRALHRNSIRSLKGAAIVPEPMEQHALKKPPQSDKQPHNSKFAEGD
jgi:hypothetical protein